MTMTRYMRTIAQIRYAMARMFFIELEAAPCLKHRPTNSS